ncbi:phosphoribosyl-ATP pyrophosphohydrolase [Aneurinibacillus sp. REN35]|uniref:phosphoribosyl-ATP pyrophosphohydrolase n=1 Tax=Aneurinibacillus sp. REN35 TaxID=3237286 RepID=UPI003529D0D2
MPSYHKLVRDLIPEIIEQAGKVCTTRKVEKEEYEAALQNKLQEEVKEYLEAKTQEEAKEELADVLEVISALANIHGSSLQDIDTLRIQKAKERGGFAKGIVLIEVKE